MSVSSVPLSPHQFTQIIPDCLTIIFSYLIYSPKPKHSRKSLLFLRKYIYCWDFGLRVNVESILGAETGKKLQYVSARNNRNVSNETFKYFRGIKELDVHCDPRLTCRFNDKALEHLGGIETLDLSHCNTITAAGIAHLRGIRTLCIHGMHRLNDAALEHLQGIQHLEMSGCMGFTNEGMSNLRGIQVLDISGCTQLTERAFFHFRSIRELRMDNCNVNARAFQFLRHIRVLRMRYCTGTPTEALMYLQGVQEVDLSYCTQITDHSLRHLNEVRKIQLQRCHLVSGDGMQYLRDVQEIDITRTGVKADGDLAWLQKCNRVTTSLPGVEKVMRNLCNATFIHFIYSKFSRDTALAHLARVEELKLYRANLNYMTDEAFRHLPHLRSISFINSKGGHFTKRMVEHVTSSGRLEEFT